ncbi:thioesterase II family protein [Streptomyces sp. TE33382]
MPDQASGDGWLRRWRPRSAGRTRLLCLPSAAGSAAMYQPWAELLPPYVELAAVELPGHGSRYGEPFADSFAAVTDAVTAALDRLPDLPTAVYGHSMGAVPALEIARALSQSAGRPPVALLVSSRDAPSVAAGATATGQSDGELLAALRELGGMDERALADRGLMDAVLPVLRADIALLAAYRYTEGPPLDCPVRVYAGGHDPATTQAGLAAWRRENPGDFRLHRLPGGDHFFFRGRERPYLARLAAELRTLARTSAGRPAPGRVGPGADR